MNTTPQGTNSQVTLHQTREVIDYHSTLLECWEAIGENPVFPTNRQTVFRLLREGMDLDVTDERLAYLESVNLFTAPGENQWEAHDVVRLAGGALALKWFREHPESRWWSRLTRYQQARYEARVQGKFDELAAELSRFSIRHVVLMILSARDQEAMAPTLEGKACWRDQADRTFATLETILEAKGLEP